MESDKHHVNDDDSVTSNISPIKFTLTDIVIYFERYHLIKIFVSRIILPLHSTNFYTVDI